MSRLPIRLRLTLAFTVAMALVLTGVGLFLYFRVRASVNETLDASLRSGASDLAAAVRVQGAAAVRSSADSFVQVIDQTGRVVRAKPAQQGTSLLTPSELGRATSSSFTVDRGTLPGTDNAMRVLAGPLGSSEVLVVGLSREAHDEALQSLRLQLFIGGPIALLLASLAGYGLAGGALRPVESMRRRAETISAATSDQRLPLPLADDEIRRLGETLNAMLDRLTAALERERAFVADASHELRTPLALLKTELELATRRPRSAEELQDALTSAAEEADRLTRLADDLLVLARADRGGLPLHPAPVAVSELFAQTAERFERRARTASRSVEVADTCETLIGDSLRLQQALGNLVDNALRHGGGVVQLSAVRRNGQLELHVTDEGDGMPADFAERAFDRFSRADEARSGEGTGLGLAIVQAVARAHGGEAGVQNRSEGGAEFWLAIPAGRTSVASLS